MAVRIEDSILESVKKLTNSEGDNYFDTDLVIHINTVFSILAQMGVGPEEGFSIDDKSTTWDEFTDDEPLFNMVKTYMAIRVKLFYDIASANSYYITQLQQEADELEWRIRAQAELVRIGEAEDA
ncbi:MAG: hypothetical protein J6X45_02330 [Lachnospiraceae bacterium]|nr:hypothetical protein [Lachnospiraceae bacterium]